MSIILYESFPGKTGSGDVSYDEGNWTEATGGVATLNANCRVRFAPDAFGLGEECLRLCASSGSGNAYLDMANAYFGTNQRVFVAVDFCVGSTNLLDLADGSYHMPIARVRDTGTGDCVKSMLIKRGSALKLSLLYRNNNTNAYCPTGDEPTIQVGTPYCLEFYYTSSSYSGTKQCIWKLNGTTLGTYALTGSIRASCGALRVGMINDGSPADTTTLYIYRVVADDANWVGVRPVNDYAYQNIAWTDNYVPSTYDHSLYDFLDAVETFGAKSILPATLSDYLIAYESQQAICTINQQFNDYLKCSETLGYIATLNISISDILKGYEALSPGGVTYDDTIYDILKLVDTLQASTINQLSFSDLLKGVETGTSRLNYNLNQSDYLKAVETLTVRLDYNLNQSDYLKLYESIVPKLTSNLSFADYLKLYENAVPKLTSNLSISDYLKLYENISSNQIVGLTISDYLKLYESIVPRLTSNLTINDYLKLYENITPKLTSNLSFSDYLKLYEYVYIAGQTYPLSFSDYLKLYENSNSRLIYNLSANDYLKLYENINSKLIFSLSINDYLKLYENVSSRLTYNLSVSDYLKLYEYLYTAGQTFNYTLYDILTGAESLVGSSVYNRGFSDLLKVVDNLTVKFTYNITLSDKITLSDVLTTFARYNIIVQDIMYLSDSLVSPSSKTDVVFKLAAKRMNFECFVKALTFKLQTKPTNFKF